jgi:5-methylcytosine-specific restriction endonuclease McrBC GTP-binding regulatory subunit McrB
MKKKAPLVEANKVDSKPFVFIIDEINRGEASKIFGELFFAIDPGYRGNKGNMVKTQYQNLVPENDTFANGFYVPENVYILATMNDIDRSVESMDFAMRRRFTWKEVTPDETESMLDALSCAAEAKATMKRLNKAITETDGLGAAFSIGPSYFLKLEKNGGDFNKLWTMNIEPLLKEYLRGMRKSSDILEKYQKAFFNTKEESTENTEMVDED